MKKLFLAAAGLSAVAALVVVQPPSVGRAQFPAGKGEGITIPVGQPQAQPSGGYLPTTPGFDKLPQPSQISTLPPGAIWAPSTDPNSPKSLREYLSQSFDDIDANQDIAVHPGCGQWMVCVDWYSGLDAPAKARAMVMELRNNPDYRLNAFVFTKGAEERRAELKKAAEYLARERQRLQDAGLSPDVPIRVPITRYQIQVAVLVGSYKDPESARRGLEQLKKLKPIDPSRVPLRTQVVVEVDERGNPREHFDQNGNLKNRKEVPVNPFMNAIVVHNPTVKTGLAGPAEEDLRLIRMLNVDEPYSALKCPKKYTLAVKSFPLGGQIQSAGATSPLFNKSALPEIKEDHAAISAHNLADLLRQWKMEAYVLHTRYCSYVTVGAFNSTDEPQIRQLQELLPKLNSDLKAQIRLASRPALMEIPR